MYGYCCTSYRYPAASRQEAKNIGGAPCPSHPHGAVQARPPALAGGRHPAAQVRAQYRADEGRHTRWQVQRCGHAPGTGSAVGNGIGSALGAGVGSAVGSGIGTAVGSGTGSGVGSGAGSDAITKAWVAQIATVRSIWALSRMMMLSACVWW